MTDAVRVGVVGVGAIGRTHARIYADASAAELVGVHDTHAGRAEQVAARYGCPVFERLEDLLPEIEAVSVAVPTHEHFDVAMACMKAGVDVLVEKPISASLAQAEEMVRWAAEAGRILQVGHVERYNPALEALLPLIDRPGFIEVHRLGSFAPRSLEVDVILDLMIHDIDVVHALTGAAVGEIRAVGVPVLSTEVDIANVRLELESGCVVNMTASRVSMGRVRKLRLFQPAAYFSVDYTDQEVACYRLERQEAGSPAITGVPVHVARAEPLVRELEDFLSCVRSRARPRVDGEAGVRALDTALAIREQMRRDTDLLSLD